VRQVFHEWAIETDGAGVHELTRHVVSWVHGSGIRDGLLTVQVQHTSASLMIQENADPEVMRDIERFWERLVPWGDSLFRHDAEGPDDMPAHIRSLLTQTSLAIPVQEGRPTLGTWQGIYLYEHRQHPHRRRVIGHLIGE
jgi:secondary thiamine-phosphate synthase enzyme